MELASGESHIVLTASPCLFWAYDRKLNTCEHVCIYIHVLCIVMDRI